MANDLSTLAPTLYQAAKEVAAEPFGIIDSISADFADNPVAVGDTVDVPVAPVRVAKDFTPGNVSTTGDDAAAADIPVEITKSRKVDWHLTGEQIRSLENGNTRADWIRQLIAQGMRTLRNEAEADCGTAAKNGAGRGFGTPATTPFASDLTDLTGVRKILADNGAPMADLQLVVDTSAGLNLRNLDVITDANLSGSDAERRSGNFLRQYGFQIRESAGIGVHTAGTGAGYLASAAIAAGDLAAPVDTGTGTVLSGDLVTFAGETAIHGVGTGIAAPGTITLNRPGAASLIADTTAMTILADYTANLAFERNAIVGIMRPPVMPVNPTIQQLLISDQFGMTYLFLDIAQYGQRTWELHLAWGFKAINGEFIVNLAG
jgi:hypothetical protein